MFGGEAPKAVAGKPGRRRGRPAKADKPAKEKKPKRHMSEEARARIVAAQKKRWARWQVAPYASPKGGGGFAQFSF